MKNLNYDINVPKLQYQEIITIDDNFYIERNLCEKRNRLFCDVVLNVGNKKTFIGRFDRVDFEVKVAYYNNKILVYKDYFDKEENLTKIVDILSLYDIKNDIFYCCTTKEALKKFDKLLDSSKIKNDKLIYRVDVEKVKRLNLKKS